MGYAFLRVKCDRGFLGSYVISPAVALWIVGVIFSSPPCQSLIMPESLNRLISLFQAFSRIPTTESHSVSLITPERTFFVLFFVLCRRKSSPPMFMSPYFRKDFLINQESLGRSIIFYGVCNSSQVRPRWVCRQKFGHGTLRASLPPPV